MAKGNLFLGTAGNSVGDVVMYRREGSQVSRVRVRKVKNPKTDAQSLQRAAFSPVAKFYSPLAVVLERSFEGLSKSKSYAKFLKTNVDLARANGWLLPKGTGFFPLPYKLSQGTLPALQYTNGVQGINVSFPSLSEISDYTTVGQMSQLFVGGGYNNGDIITVILIKGTDATGYVPVVGQFEIDTTSTVLLAGLMAGIEITISSGPGNTPVNFNVDADWAGGAIIAARFVNDKWRRSTQTLLVKASIISEISADSFKAAAIASYGPNAGDPNPLVYLDGDTLEG